MDGARERSCETCGAGLDGAQRYCLSCGTRAGARSPQLLKLKRLAVARPPETSPAPAEAAAAERAPARPVSGLRLPTPRIAALLVLVFLGFGALLGSAAGSGRGRLSADVSPRLKLIVPAAPATSGVTSSSSEAPEAEAETTPEAGAENPAASTATSAASTNEKAGGEQKEPEERGGEGAAAKPLAKLPAIKHVFVILLDNEPYASVFGPESKARYLAGTLERKGELLVRYDAVAHEQLANGIALLSGQGPTAQTAANCPSYVPLVPGGAGASGQALGEGCVYPATTMTLPGQLAARHLKWRAYIEGIDEPGTPSGACAHPAPGSADATLAGGPYATSRNPFVYFDSLISTPSCAADDVGMAALSGDLAKGSGAPSLAYIVPDRCHDAGPTPCSTGAETGPADADSFLETVVPRILASKAYKDGGLLVITTDEAPSSGEFADSSSCCGQPSYPDLPSVEGTGRGGGAVGALLLSPFVKGSTTSQEPYNHFSLLRTIEDIFKLKHLGYAGLSGVKPLAPALFTASAKG